MDSMPGVEEEEGASDEFLDEAWLMANLWVSHDTAAALCSKLDDVGIRSVPLLVAEGEALRVNPEDNSFYANSTLKQAGVSDAVLRSLRNYCILRRRREGGPDIYGLEANGPRAREIYRMPASPSPHPSPSLSVPQSQSSG